MAENVLDGTFSGRGIMFSGPGGGICNRVQIFANTINMRGSGSNSAGGIEARGNNLLIGGNRIIRDNFPASQAIGIATGGGSPIMVSTNEVNNFAVGITTYSVTIGVLNSNILSNVNVGVQSSGVNGASVTVKDSTLSGYPAGGPPLTGSVGILRVGESGTGVVYSINNTISGFELQTSGGVITQ